MNDVGAFHERGYLIVENALDVDVVERVGAFLTAAADAAARGEARPEEVERVRSGHFPLDVRLSPRLWDIPREEGLARILRACSRSDELFMHMPPTARFILPGNSAAAVPPHQDVSYNHHLTDFITAWVPFHPIDEESGGVAVFSGSQAVPEILDSSERDLWLRAVPTDGFRRVECAPMKPGDVLLLNPLIIHESMPNRSSRTRVSMDMRFVGRREGSSKHVLNCQTWHVMPPEEG